MASWINNDDTFAFSLNFASCASWVHFLSSTWLMFSGPSTSWPVSVPSLATAQPKSTEINTAVRLIKHTGPKKEDSRIWHWKIDIWTFYLTCRKLPLLLLISLGLTLSHYYCRGTLAVMLGRPSPHANYGTMLPCITLRTRSCPATESSSTIQRSRCPGLECGNQPTSPQVCFRLLLRTAEAREHECERHFPIFILNANSGRVGMLHRESIERGCSSKEGRKQWVANEN